MIKGMYEAHLPVRNLDISIEFYKKLDLEIAYRQGNLAFFWIEKNKSWLGLWETDRVDAPYHPSMRHIALQIDLEDMKNAKDWLKSREINGSTNFDFLPEGQPHDSSAAPKAHAAVYFKDPDGNSIELIAPLRLDAKEELTTATLENWDHEL